MAKTKISEYDSTAANNTDIDSINIAEGMAPSNVNNAIRELMAHLKDGLGAGTPVFLDQTNNRLGVGTDSPGHLLTVGDGATGTKTIAINGVASGSSVMDLDFRGGGSGNPTGRISFSSSTEAMTFHTGDLASISEAVRIDNSQNLLVGKTSADSGATAGIETNNNGRLNATRDGSISGVFNRLTSDGEIVQVRRSGTSVGAIGTAAYDLTIHSTASGHKGIRLHDSGILPTDNTGAIENNTSNLGHPSYAFKDLYLSGGAYIGGTAAANYFDDYEEGTWSAALAGPTSVGYSSEIGVYTKIGRSVWCSFTITFSTAPTGSTNYRFILPFTPTGSTTRMYGGDLFMVSGLTDTDRGLFLGIYNGTTNVYVYTVGGTARNTSGNFQTGTISGRIYFET